MVGICPLVALCCALASAGAANARHARRPICHLYRCTTVAQDRLVRIVRGETLEVARHEAIKEGPRWWFVWRPTGRGLPLPELEPSPSRFAVAGRWVAWANGCDYGCGVSVHRIDVDSGRLEGNPVGGPPYTEDAVRRGESQRPGEPCFTYGTAGSQESGVTALVVSDSGAIAWIQSQHVCEMPRGSDVPSVLASNPEIAPSYLRLVDGHVYWKEETVHSAPFG